MLRFDRKQQNSVKQLSFNLKINKFKNIQLKILPSFGKEMVDRGKRFFLLFYPEAKQACSVAPLCPTLCNPRDYSLSSVHGIFQARTQE